MTTLPSSPPSLKMRRPLLWILALLLIGVFSVYGYWVVAQHRLTVISPNKVYQSAAMSPAALEKVVTANGIQTVFDFRGDPDDSPAIVNERRMLESHGLHYRHIPSSTRPDPQTVDQFLKALGPEVAQHRVLLLHCHDGEGRAVFYSAVYRMEYEGWDPRKAYEGTTRLPPSLMFLNRLIPGLGRLADTNPKTPLILNYRPHHSDFLDAQSPLVAPN